MNKIRLGVIFGGMSTENEVSVISATSILNNLDREKYEIYPIYIGKDGIWYEYEEMDKKREFGQSVKQDKKIPDVMQYLRNMDVLFPVLHGLYGEDGTIQGLFELLKVPYVGCGVLASSVGMDKAYTKIIFERAKLEQAKYIYVREYKGKYICVDSEFNEKVMSLSEVTEIVEKNLKYPVFVKPSNSGSSVGINKAKNRKELVKNIEFAAQFDNKVLIEEGIIGQEVECAVLGNEEVIASCVGEIKSADEFYSYDAKYKNSASKTNIPADLPKETIEEIKKQAIKAFKAIDGKGLARVDFFVEEKTKKVYVNEINTLPGFTNISMYPKLFEASGISYKELLNKLIELAL